MNYFGSVHGQQHLKRLLASAFGGERLSHAYLLEGRRGLGKYAFALEVARTYLCKEYPGPACGRCRSCRCIESGSHPDLQVVFPFPNLRPESRKLPVFPFSHLAKQGARYSQETLKEVERFRLSKRQDPYRIIDFEKKPNIPIEIIKDLRAYLDLKPQLSSRRAVIVLEVELMAHLAANVFLKTVEEPPPHSLIILTTCNPGAILPTIKSRCQVLHFAPIQEEALKKVVTSRFNLEPQRLGLVVRAAAGSIGLAEKFCHQKVWETRDVVLEVLSDLLLHGRTSPQELATGLADSQPESIFGAFLWIFRDLYLLRKAGSGQKLVNLDIQDRLQEIAAAIANSAALEEAMTLTSQVQERFFTLNLDLEFSLVYIILKLKDLFAAKAH